VGIHVIKMPDLGEGIAECEVVAWRVQPGDTITEDQVLADVMTDKATVEIPSPVHGTVMALGGKVGDSLPVGGELIRLEIEGAGNFKGDAAKPATAAAAAALRPAADEPADLPHGFVPEPQRVAAGAASVAAAPAAPVAARAAAAPAHSPAARSVPPAGQRRSIARAFP
jgi:2-oxoisovalerate dehydrogenase E2 component (dihydrolipoyl transacylase)